MYDVIVVGARCAGSPTAMLLARKGHRVLVVDRDTFPSDIMSTHYIQTPGVAHLEKWGLLDAVRAAGTPAIETLTFHMGPMSFVPPKLPGAPDLPAYCPRRTVLDKILVDAARDAGAEVREGFSVQELTFDRDTVTGIRGRTDGAEVAEEAKITVGADGLHSRVARAVQAPAYNERPSYTCAYYTYWGGLDLEGADIYLGDTGGVLSFPTNDGQTCIAVGKQNEMFAEFRSDIEGNYMRWLAETAPDFAKHVGTRGKREERFVGTADVPNFFKKPYGSGWALVGDAGYHKDPVTGLGIMDCFRDAELLADAIDAGLSGRQPLEQALAGYQQRRDEAATPLYEFTCALASGNVPPEMAQLFAPPEAATPAASRD